MELFDLLQKVIEVFERARVPYLVTGSVAAMAYGEPRLTNDIDIVAAINEQHIPELLAAFPSEEFYIDADMIKEEIRRGGQFNIIHPASGLKVDVLIKNNTEFDTSLFNRPRRIRPVEAYQANFASPEDVIIKKMEYYNKGGSEKHLRDITGILKISKGAVDLEYITRWAASLGLSEVWAAVRKRAEEKP